MFNIILVIFIFVELSFANIILSSSIHISTRALNGSSPKDLGGSGPHTFDYLLGESKNLKSNAKVLFLDYDLDESVIRKQLDIGKRVICYVNVGSWENWRADKSAFPSSVLGNDYDGWPGEKWLDIRKLDILLPIMRDRFRIAKRKGCEGIDPDNMDGYQQNTSFPLTSNHQREYNKAISDEIHASGMLAGLKNDNDQAIELLPYTDFAVVESCAYYEECENFNAFIQANKPVFAIEYTNLWTQAKFKKDVCPYATATRMSFILKKLNLLNNYIVPCNSAK